MKTISVLPNKMCISTSEKKRFFTLKQFDKKIHQNGRVLMLNAAKWQNCPLKVKKEYMKTSVIPENFTSSLVWKGSRGCKIRSMTYGPTSYTTSVFTETNSKQLKYMYLTFNKTHIYIVIKTIAKLWIQLKYNSRLSDFLDLFIWSAWDMSHNNKEQLLHKWE